ncbi:methyltransferase-like protein 6 [Acanthaster planci]|uniref:tRNA N(3)-methylcytidine methyltransferase n=1 Tax=Acanthaster planci TaxID=133434 RepID=A0A8B7Z4Q1_ACAPL|nr:methyltransferase-like protein 6 [Acanthaster planci]XP_022099937.1 methyltransferase-like protein 6 [Acanthaster planci]
MNILETENAAAGSADPSISPSDQEKGHRCRQLTVEEWTKLNADNMLVSDYKQAKLEREARKNWDLFYKRNSTNFFKDRHWTTREFCELAELESKDGSRPGQRFLLEVGCGVGNAIYPLLEENRQLFVYACDFSPRAVQFVKENPAYDPSRICVFQCDLTADSLRESIPECHLDIVTMLFVLSAIHPEKMPLALKNVYEVLKPGGCVLFRDYGLYDHAMLRFSKGHKLGENFYVRQDGTRAYYFTEEHLSKLFTEAGFEAASSEYVLRETVNKKEGLCVPRVFVQGKFTKPSQSLTS